MTEPNQEGMRLFPARKQLISISGDLGLPPAFVIALTQLGVREVPGQGANPHITDYFTATHYHATSDEVPWCSAFACWCAESAGIHSPRSAAALDWIEWAKKTDRLVMAHGHVTRGELLVYARPEAGPKAGHVAFYSHTDKAGCWVLGGNQGNEVCLVARKDAPIAVVAM